ncbi:unnamed protein product [Pylaiella littoralis]
MILPVIINDGQGPPFADTLTKRLAALSELVLQVPDGSAGPGAEVIARYKTFLGEFGCRVGPFDVLSEDRDAKTDAVVAWLDSGARRAIVSLDISDPAAVQNFAAWSSQLPASRHRLVASLRARDLEATSGGEDGGGERGSGRLAETLRLVMGSLRPVVGCVQIDFEGGYAAAPQVLEELKALRGKEGAPDYVELVFTRSSSSEGVAGEAGEGKGGVESEAGATAGWTPEEVGKLHLGSGVDVQSAARLELQGAREEEEEGGGDGGAGVDAASAFLACLRTDRPDGLLATVVCDTMGIALGLVYSNSASIRASVESGRGVYWSRSRGGLWRKGDTSGAWQELRSISVDCDSDAIKFTVWQHGNPPAFCHFNRRNCWEEERGLGHLERMLVTRKEQAPEGSYTKRLFEDPVLLRNKLVEEAQELAEAETKKHVAEEAADVTYFMMVRCAAAGVSWEDVEKELDMRSLKLKRRPGNAKAERIAEGDRILGAGRKVEVASLT